MIGALLARKAMFDAFEALNRHDLPKFMSGWRDDGAFIYPGDVPASGTFQGKSAVEGWFRSFLDRFPTIQFDVRDICVRNIYDLVGNNIVTVRWDVDLTDQDGKVGHNSGVTVVGIKGGKAFLAQDFLFDQGEDFRRYWGAA